MKLKKIILIGTIGCGKTTLSQALTDDQQKYEKTQAVQIRGETILDTPGEYLERTAMRGALMITSAEAEIVALLQSATEPRAMFSPCYAGCFAKEVIGIVTKIDAASAKQIEDAEKKLQIAGAEKIFRVSSLTGEGLEELKQYLAAEDKKPESA